MVLVGFVYILYILRRSDVINFAIRKGLNWTSFLRRISLTFIVVALATTFFVWFQDKEALFYVPKHNPGLFIVIVGVYTIVSVWPQELIFRTFFFERYAVLFRNKSLLVFVNAIVFSLAHLFFRNTLVLILTFVGGLLFGYTYMKYRSTTAVSIEHALYGNWLFAVGMGQMLAFPGMET